MHLAGKTFTSLINRSDRMLISNYFDHVKKGVSEQSITN